ncbi:hypothetical protein G9A89_002078 [Geosiphon pyriformis]|nr:hypothetical protein G9A89_002078 [Geosiphon pyriformis]
MSTMEAKEENLTPKEKILNHLVQLYKQKETKDATEPLQQFSSLYELRQMFGGNGSCEAEIFSKALQELVNENLLKEHKRQLYGSEGTLTLYSYVTKKSEKELVSSITPKTSKSSQTLKRKEPPCDDLDSNSDPIFIAEKEKLRKQIEPLQERLDSLRAEEIELMGKLEENIDIQSTIDHHCHLLHDYNEIKDIGQMLFGKCAEIEGMTTAKMYERFGVEIHD